MQACAGLLCGVDGHAEFFQRRLRFDDDGIYAGIDEGFGLLCESGTHLGFGEISVRLHQAAEGSDVADDKADAIAEGLTGDFDGGLVDLDDLVGIAVAVEHDAASAEGVGENAIGSGVGVAALDGEDFFGMGEIPFLAAVSLEEAGEHELGAHRAVADERAIRNCLEESWFHVGAAF